MGLESPAQGNISWRGEPLAKLNRAQRKAFRRDIQMVFQDSISAVNPRKTVREILREPMRHLLSLKKSEQLARASEMLKAVDLDDSVLDKRPPQLSGGQLQRVCPARALAVEPKLLILDEAVSNLDLVLQAGVIRLLKKLQQQFGTACPVHHPRLTPGRTLLPAGNGYGQRTNRRNPGGGREINLFL